MNKKFLSAILFGALMVTSTGTFVSCKDYDDDIDNLQEQINKLATKEEMSSQIATLNSALSAAASEAAAAKATAADALAKATASEKAAAQAALDAAAAKEEAIKAAQDEVAAAKAELEASMDAKFEANKKELAEMIAALTEKVEKLTGYTTEMLTGLQIQNVTGYSPAMDLNYATVDIKYPKNLAVGGAIQTPSSYEFGKGMPGAFTLTDGDVNTTKSTILVKADPVNAVIAAENLSLINTKNVDVDDFVTYSVKPYTGLVVQNQSRSAIGGTGLYAVGVQLKKNMTSEDFEKFDKLVISGNEHSYDVDQCDGIHYYYKYALAVNDYAKERSVTTGWDITMHVQKEGMALNIPYYSMLYSSARHANNERRDCIGYFSWANDNANSDDEYAFPVVKDEAFELVVGYTGGRVMASYVVVDYDNELLSVTDQAALKGITVDGVNEVSTNNKFSLTVSGTYAAGVPVPLKLVTVDYTGNIEVNVFWVKAGEPALMTAAFSVTPSTNVANPTAWVAESTMEEFKIPAGATKYTLEFVVGETNHQDPTRFKEANTIDNINNGVLNLYKSDKIAKTTDVSKVAYAKFVGALNLQVMREDKAYEGVVKFYNATGTYLGSNTITVKKVLPTVIPAGLSAKENAINNGVLTVYPVAAANGKGEFELANAFNFANGLDNDANLSFNAPSLTGYPYYASFTNDRKIANIPANIISADAKFPTTVVYNYGDIKYHAEGHGVSEPGDCKVTWTTAFDIKFNCYPVDCTYSWFNTPVVYYKESVVLDGHARKADGTITENRNVIKVLDPYAKEVNAFSTVADNPWLIWAERLNTYSIELWTNGDNTKVNEFHTAAWAFDNANGGKVVINLTKQSTDVVLSGDVEISVMIKIQDKFTDHVHYVPALKYTMKKDHVVTE